jgi:glycosyltransferase involved in cell wall biosynthesis
LDTGQINMSSTPTVTVVIPLYNKGLHIDRALDAALNQTVAVDEVIIVDDASTDDGLSKVRKWQDPRIRIIERSEPGPGGYAARNAGIEAASSEWIAFLDADDSWRPFAVEEIHRLARQADAKVGSLFTAYDRDYGDQIVPMPSFAEIIPQGTRRFDFNSFVRAWLKIGHSPMWTSAVAARRSTLLKAGLFPAGRCKRGGDKDLWLRLLWTADALASARSTASYHRDSINMVTKTISMNHYPYLCGTMKALLPTGDLVQDRLIRQLINLEIFTSAKEAYRNEGRIVPAVYEGFDWRLDISRFAQIYAMRSLPRKAFLMLRTLKSMAGAKSW